MNAVIFSVLPISIMCLCMQFRLNFKYAGLWVMSLISWLAAANAVLTLIIIRAYRLYFLQVTGLARVCRALGMTRLEMSESQRTKVTQNSVHSAGLTSTGKY